MIALDTETNLIRPSCQLPPLVCVSVSDGNRLADVIPWTSARPTIEAFLSSMPIVGHNIAYDMGVIMAQWPDLIPLVFKAYDEDRVTDTGSRQKLLDIRDGKRKWQEDDEFKLRKSTYGLDALSQRHLGRNLAKDGGIQLTFESLRHVPFEQWPALSVEYSRDDALATWQIWAVQEQRAEHLADQYRQARAALFLRLASAWGLIPHPPSVAAFRARIEREIEECAVTLRAAGLLRADGSRMMSNVAARVYQAYTALGEACPVTDKGNVKTDQETCERSGDTVLATFGQFSQLRSVVGKDFKILSTPIIHSRFEECVDNGRTASTSPNVQNLATEGGMRECFRPREGCVYVVADYAGFELSTFAQVCYSRLGHSALRDILIRGDDPHLRLAERILGRPYDELVAIKKAGSAHPEYETVYHARQTGKVGNFGFMGGAGAARVAKEGKVKYGVTMTENEARALKATWIGMVPEAGEYFRWVEANGGTVEQLFSGRVRNGCGFTDACNSPFSGLAADCAKDAGYQIAKAQYTGRMVARTVNFIHDEFVLETPEDCIDDTAALLESIMLDSARRWIPDVPCSVEVLATRAYSKKAKRIVKDGRLIPWEPT